jgi:hypothetical protein
MFKSVAKIIYSPASHLGHSKNWAILKCDEEIGKYYRQLYQKEHQTLNGGYPLKLIQPIFGNHISYIRGSDKISNEELWGLSENEMVEFKYLPGVLDNGKYYWLKVICPFLSELRMKYNLAPEPKYGLHLTIGIAV